jgi:ABC-type uncharacterized transport system fused permease/ATPase subunit
MIKSPRTSATSKTIQYPNDGSFPPAGIDGLMVSSSPDAKTKRYPASRPNDASDGIFRTDDNDNTYGFKGETKKQSKGDPYKDKDRSADESMNHSTSAGSNKAKRTRIHWSHVREQMACMVRMGLPYFIESRQAKILVFKLIVFLLLDNGINILYSYVNRDLWNALSAKDSQQFSKALLHYGVTLMVIAPIDAMYMFQMSQLALHWRAWLTTRTIQLYTTHPVYYTLEMQRCQQDVTTTSTDTGATYNTNDKSDAFNKVSTSTIDATRALIDNPDQRISEDVEEYTKSSIQLCFSCISNVIQLCSFSVILYTIYPHLLWMAFVYAISATGIIMMIFHPMIQLNVEHLRYEANLRYTLVRFREHVEAIAFHRSSQIEQHYIVTQLMNVVNNQYSINLITRLYNLMTYAYNLTRSIVPVVIVVRHGYID